MAQRVLGIDLGAHTVKVAEVEVGFRTAELIRLQSLAVAPGPEPVLERSVRALAGLQLPQGHVDIVTLGVPGDLALMRLLEIPIADPRKLAAVVANELADDIPWELPDVVYDHHPLYLSGGKVFAAAARSEEVRRLLAEVSALGIDPRTLPLAPMSYTRLVRYVAEDATLLLVDLGHRRTNLFFLAGGRPMVARTLSRGGHQITEAFRQTFQLTYLEAQELKEREAVLASPGAGPLDPARAVYAQVTADAMAPLVRELIMSRELFVERLGRQPERVLLCGGTSLLRGVEAHLEEALGLPCARLSLDDAEGLVAGEQGPGGHALCALSLGLALEQGTRQVLDLRQGEFAYQADRSALREKLLAVAVSVVMVLLFMAASAFSSLYALRKDERALKRQLKQATLKVLGRSLSSPRRVSREVKQGSRAAGAGISEKTAFDVLDMISGSVPGGEKVKLDLLNLDIKPGKTYIKGTADTRTQIGEIVKSLEAISCFEKVVSGKISGVADEKKQFTLTIKTKCF